MAQAATAEATMAAGRFVRRRGASRTEWGAAPVASPEAAGGGVDLGALEDAGGPESRIEASAEELGRLIEQNDTPENVRRVRTEALVHTISSEIDRILKYDPADETEEEEEVVEEAKGEETQALAPQEGDEVDRTESGDAVQGADQAEEDPATAAEVDAIMQRIESRQMELPSIDVDELESLLGYMSDSDSGKGSGGEPSAVPSSKSTLTPYELWRHSRWKEQEQPSRKELTEEEWAVVVSRLGKYQQEKEIKRMRAQHKVLREELRTLKFKPRINASSRRMAQVQPIYERLDAVIDAKKARIDLERKRLLAQEAALCTGKPKLNRTKRWRPQVSRKYVSAGATDFTEEDLEMTFSPKINKRSVALAERATRRGKRLAIDAAQHRRECKPEEFPFRPKINARSRAVPHASDEPVHDRLFRVHLQALRDPGRAPRAPRNERHGDANCVPFDADRHAFLAARVPVSSHKPRSGSGGVR